MLSDDTCDLIVVLLVTLATLPFWALLFHGWEKHGWKDCDQDDDEPG